VDGRQFDGRAEPPAGSPRGRLTCDGKLLGAVTRVFSDSVLSFYRRRLRALDGVTGHSGAVTVVQRTSADLRLNPHFHAILLDGIYALDDDATPVFHPLPSLDTEDVADVLQVVRIRLLNLLKRQGVIEDRSEHTLHVAPERTHPCRRLTPPRRPRGRTSALRLAHAELVANATWPQADVVDAALRSAALRRPCPRQEVRRGRAGGITLRVE